MIKLYTCIRALAIAALMVSTSYGKTNWSSDQKVPFDQYQMEIFETIFEGYRRAWPSRDGSTWYYGYQIAVAFEKKGSTVQCEFVFKGEKLHEGFIEARSQKDGDYALSLTSYLKLSREQLIEIVGEDPRFTPPAYIIRELYKYAECVRF